MEDACPFDVDEDPFRCVVAMELLLEFDVAKSALVQAEERAQLAGAALLSVARPAQDALLRLEALAGPLLRAHSPLMRLKREVAAKEAAELNDLHQAEIALARANVVNGDIAT